MSTFLSCQHCSQGPFKDRGGLKLHQTKYCSNAQAANSKTGDLLRKRKQLQDEEKVKRARLQAEETENPSVEIQSPSSPLPAIPDLLSGPSQSSVTSSFPERRPSGRPNRRRRLPKQYNDFIPSALSGRSSAHLGVPDTYQPVVQPSPPPPEPSDSLLELPATTSECVETNTSLLYKDCDPNSFGLFRSYLELPICDPEVEVSLDSVDDTPSLVSKSPDRSRWLSPLGGLGAIRNKVGQWFAPFLNPTTYYLMEWFYTGSSALSLKKLNQLVHHVLLRNDFSTDDLRGFNATKEAERLDEWVDEDNGDDCTPLKTSDGWRESSVHIHVPAEGIKHSSEDAAPVFEIKGVFHRGLVDVIKSAFQDSAASTYNLIPYRLFWNSSASSTAGSTAESASPPERVYSEMYNSEAMLDEYEKLIKTHPRDPDAPFTETVIAAMMFWSDSTHLAQFGNASLWPIYLFFGNQSKYARSKPSMFAAHHVAYIPSLPDIFQDFYMATFGRAASSAVLTHCKRELMHAIWSLMLDDDFVKAYEHGIVLHFADGISRRVFPRIFTYSADYPEKVLLATIKYLAACPCPRCLVQKDQIAALGMQADIRRRNQVRVDSEKRRLDVSRVRRWIFESGYSFVSTYVKRILDVFSGVPTLNAFSTRLSQFGFDFHTMLVPDLLHEFELGVWKAIFIHLLRVLYAAGGDKIQTLNERFRLIPTFGRDTIRRFSRNTSAMKKLAARDWEDILQCALPVFEGLLAQQFDDIVQDVLFIMASWHAYAKLRIHTTTTLHLLESSTVTLGQVLRHFQKTVCAFYDTCELPSEEAARGRRKAALAKKGKNPLRLQVKGNASVKRRRTFNMNTYKLHSLGDYLKYIYLFGPSDNYSTQVGELEHRRVKRFYARTSKNHFVRQITKQHRRHELLRKISRKKAYQEGLETQTASTSSPRSVVSHTVPLLENEPLPYTTPDRHYHMSQSNRFPLDVSAFLSSHCEDPAVQSFLPQLKNHLLSRLLGLQYDGDEHTFSDQDRERILIINNKMYRHKVLRINYTTYDVRRAQDSLNPRTHADIMVLSHEDDADSSTHPYWYARIIGLYHIYVALRGPELSPTRMAPVRLEFAWIRWFGRDPAAKSGFRARRLPRIGFVDNSSGSEGGPAFGFLDPQHIVRGVHLIPAFAHGRTTDLLGPSIVRQPQENDEDWQFYYVMIFVDRDMFMRFRGGGIGHQTMTTQAARELLDDTDLPAEVESDTPEDAAAIAVSGEIDLENECHLLEDEPADFDDHHSDPNDDGSIDDEELDFGYQRYDEEEDEYEEGLGNGEADLRPENEDEESLGLRDGEDELEEDADEDEDLAFASF